MTERSKKTVTLSMRVTEHEAEQIRIAAASAYLTVAEYIKRRVADRPIISTPNLAALAHLMRTLRLLEVKKEADPQLIGALHRDVANLSLIPPDKGELI